MTCYSGLSCGLQSIATIAGIAAFFDTFEIPLEIEKKTFLRLLISTYRIYWFILIRSKNYMYNKIRLNLSIICSFDAFTVAECVLQCTMYTFNVIHNIKYHYTGKGKRVARRGGQTIKIYVSYKL